MNNQKVCFYCHSGTKYMPITNKKGEIISLHSICQNPNCSVNLTMLALKKRKSTLNLKKRIKPTQKKSRVLQGILVMLTSLVISWTGLTALANYDYANNTQTYVASRLSTSTTKTKETVDVESPKTLKIELGSTKNTKANIRAYVLYQASSTGVWVDKIDHMVENESHYDPTAIGDMKLICQYGKNKGKPVRAKGIWQITDCGHPEITDEQAFDIEWSTAWALSIISKSQKDCRNQWTTCDSWYKI